MDELDALRQMRTALAREESPDRLALRTNWRSGTPSRRRRSFKVPIVSVISTAALVAGAVVVISVTSSPAPDGVPPVRLGENGGAHEPGNALLVAATNVQKGPTREYWHTTRISGEIYAVGKTAADHYKVESRTQYDEWTDPRGKECVTVEGLPARPWTAVDKQKWQKAGAPTVVKVPTAEGPAALFLKDMQPGAPCRKLGDRRFLGMTPKQLAALPTEPENLESVLLNLKGDWEAYTSKAGERPIRALKGDKRVRALSDAAGTLLAGAPTPPAVRAAAFRMLATLPGVKAEGKATDPLGRPGTVISLPVETTVPLGIYTAPKQLGTYRRQWIIDPGDGTLLAIRDLVATPPHGSRQLPPGDDGKPRRLTVASQPDRFHKPGELSQYEVYAVAEWTDTAPN
ncbi:CU044_5270 family protein [Planotetraspora mira]|nr:CU044_5270 family protein [Planotetraspora mira]